MAPLLSRVPRIGFGNEAPCDDKIICSFLSAWILSDLGVGGAGGWGRVWTSWIPWLNPISVAFSPIPISIVGSHISSPAGDCFLALTTREQDRQDDRGAGPSFASRGTQLTKSACTRKVIFGVKLIASNFPLLFLNEFESK